MNLNARFRRLIPAIVLPVTQFPIEESLVTLHLAGVLPESEIPGLAMATFWVGEYEVGRCFCPHLYGHPGIRY